MKLHTRFVDFPQPGLRVGIEDYDRTFSFFGEHFLSPKNSIGNTSKKKITFTMSHSKSSLNMCRFKNHKSQEKYSMRLGLSVTLMCGLI